MEQGEEARQEQSKSLKTTQDQNTVLREENRKLQAQLKNSERVIDDMKERLKLQADVTDAALKEVDLSRTLALNASKSDVSPLKAGAAAEEQKERESLPLHQMLDATLQLNSADSLLGKVASPDVSVSQIKPRTS